jgi:hypothetical protein
MTATLPPDYPAEPGAFSLGATAGLSSSASGATAGSSTSAVVPWSPDHATPATEGLLTTESRETFGPTNVRGRETRAQHLETRAQHGKRLRAVDGTLIDLLAESIADNWAQSQSAFGGDRTTLRRQRLFAEVLGKR